MLTAMGPVLSAVVVLSALTASAVLLVHLVVTEGRRQDRRSGAGRRRAPTGPLPPGLSSDGEWAWTGSGWMPARWGAMSAPPPGPVVAQGRESRSHGCMWAAGVGCVLLLSMAGMVVLVVLALLAGLVSLLAAALGG